MTIKPCPFCDQPFELEKLKNHIGTVHLGLPDLPECSKEEAFENNTQTAISTEQNEEAISNNEVNDLIAESKAKEFLDFTPDNIAASEHILETHKPIIQTVTSKTFDDTKCSDCKRQ